MFMLCAQQQRYVDELKEIALGASYLPSTLLIGPPGSGKRVIASASAEQLNIAFVPVSVSGSPAEVLERLRGSSDCLGELAQAPDGPTILYLTDLQRLDPSLQHFIQKLIATRKYVDVDGDIRAISEDLWIIGSMSFPERDCVIDPEHWLTTNFSVRVDIDIPRESAELLLICKSMATKRGRGHQIEQSGSRLAHILPSLGQNLDILEHYLAAALRIAQPNSVLDEEIFARVIAEDVQRTLTLVRYRGTALNESQIKRWIEQFPTALHPLAAQLCQHIAKHYFIDVDRYFRALEDLSARSDIPRGSAVSFCHWQPLGKSAPRVAHELKNLANWKILPDVDLDQPEEAWPQLQNPRWFVIADDFIGTGKTLLALTQGDDPAIARLLRRYPTANLRILVLAGFHSSSGRLQASLRGLLDARQRLIISLLYHDEDRCFNERSRIFPRTEQRDEMRAFCLRLARERKLPYPLGYDDSQALIVFYDTVPNNSLSILWCNRNSWEPLFPASGLIEDSVAP